MSLRRAQRFLKNVVAKKEIVPFRRFNGGVGRKAQVSLAFIYMILPGMSNSYVIIFVKDILVPVEILP